MRYEVEDPMEPEPREDEMCLEELQREITRDEVSVRRQELQRDMARDEEYVRKLGKEHEKMRDRQGEVLMLGEKRKGLTRGGKYDLCELFSQARVTKRIRESNSCLRPGWSLDLNFDDEVTGRRWDLSLEEDQEKVIRRIKKEKPLVIGLSPECTLFSALQNLRKIQ